MSGLKNEPLVDELRSFRFRLTSPVFSTSTDDEGPLFPMVPRKGLVGLLLLNLGLISNSSLLDVERLSLSTERTRLGGLDGFFETMVESSLSDMTMVVFIKTLDVLVTVSLAFW